MNKMINVSIRGSLMILLIWTMNACQSDKASDSTAADEAAIRTMVEKSLDMFTGINKDNASEFVRFMYAEDAILFPPNSLPIKGMEPITEFLAAYPPMEDYRHEPKEIVVFGDYAYLWQAWSVTLPLADQTSYKDAGTIIWIWHKQDDGGWKLWREIWHSDLPLTVTPVSEP